MQIYLKSAYFSLPLLETPPDTCLVYKYRLLQERELLMRGVSGNICYVLVDMSETTAAHISAMCTWVVAFYNQGDGLAVAGLGDMK